MRRLAPIAVAIALLPAIARATPEVDVTPDVILAGGYDDNLLFNNQGGDAIGRTGLRLKIVAEDHLWRFAFDGSASIYGFAEHERLIPLGELKTVFTRHLARDDELHMRIQAEGSDDPMTLAQLGLLGPGGSAIGFKSVFEWDHRFEDERWDLINGLHFDGERYLGDGYAQYSGQVAGLFVKPRYFLTRDLAVETAFDARTFFSTVLIGNSVGVLPGLYYRLARRWFAEVQVGGGLFFDGGISSPVWIARGLMTWSGRRATFELTLTHDLAPPTDRAGVIESEVAEAAYRYELREWQVVVRGGFYRTLASPTADEWTPAYGAQAGVFYKVTPGVWAGISGLHFDQIGTSFEPAVVRDAIFLRFDFTSATPM